jgi:3-vinyl bacteriochlorophyllide hydratase
MLTSMLGRIVAPLDGCPWGGAAGRPIAQQHTKRLYTPEQKLRRDSSPWTLIQGILAPIQFLVFLVSLVLVLRTLATGEGVQAATASVVIKTFTLYTIMITGAIWEREVFGQYLFAPGFYWEDMVSMVVLALHTAYLWALHTGTLGTEGLLLLALAAYGTYVVNAAQFVLKLRAARKQDCAWRPAHNTHSIGFGQSA